ncbi:AhpA/YtjB family protein [Providencia vermicola]|uniref:Protein smp n=1 Tax=Providencia stuartii TaxID=588 RepID=A0AAI9MXL2_PROST|nr:MULTISPECIES: AhpA/YtjB family protein [Providencia]ELR5034891.1 protein smp [Providencia stuartii]ELR5037883.1 protein smp [Providencia stuartii]ELR5122304.1 protein smp [Providencia stuartii]ELR5142658.1 protein smp [Providencia stuartii]ELR5292594.1 protein smp [Providencia stuartii]
MKLTFKLHKTVIIVICVALIALLMQGISYLGTSQNQSRVEQFKQLTRVLAEQVAFSLSDYIVSGSKDFNRERIIANLKNVTKDKYILDASIYSAGGTLIASAGESVSVRERLAIDSAQSTQPFQYQLVVPILGQEEPKGYLRLTIDTELLTTEIQQADNSTNVLRFFILFALCIGFVLANTLFRSKKKKGKNTPPQLVVDEDSGTEEDDNMQPTASKRAHSEKKKPEHRPYRPKKRRAKSKPNKPKPPEH